MEKTIKCPFYLALTQADIDELQDFGNWHPGWKVYLFEIDGFEPDDIAGFYRIVANDGLLPIGSLCESDDDEDDDDEQE